MTSDDENLEDEFQNLLRNTNTYLVNQIATLAHISRDQFQQLRDQFKTINGQKDTIKELWNKLNIIPINLSEPVCVPDTESTQDSSQTSLPPTEPEDLTKVYYHLKHVYEKLFETCKSFKIGIDKQNEVIQSNDDLIRPMLRAIKQYDDSVRHLFYKRFSYSLFYTIPRR